MYPRAASRATSIQSSTFILLVISILLTLLIANLLASQSQFTVDTGYSRYQGRLSTAPNLANPPVLFLGIPYAGPPTGNNRFRAPPLLDKAALKKDRDAGKVVDATQYPLFCIQGTIGQGDAGGAGSEDCLKVNVYAPQGAKDGSNCEFYFCGLPL